MKLVVVLLVAAFAFGCSEADTGTATEYEADTGTATEYEVDAGADAPEACSVSHDKGEDACVDGGP